jgi:hypothetical protein
MNKAVRGMISKTRKTKKKTVKRTISKEVPEPVAKEVPERVAEGTIPLAALQSLLGLSESLQKMRTSGNQRSAASAPMVILTGSGLELRFAGAEQAQQTAPEAASPERGLKSVLDRVAQVEKSLEPLVKRIARAERGSHAEKGPGMPPGQLASIEAELKALRQSTTALRDSVAKDVRTIEKTLESHSAAIDSVRAAISQNEELVESIVETLQMLNGGSEDPLAVAS